MAEAGLVAEEGVGEIGIDLDGEAQGFAFREAAGDVFAGGQRAAECERCGLQLEFSGLDGAEIEEIVDEPEEELALGVDGVDVVPLGRGQRGAGEEFTAAEDALERGAELVAEEGEEFAFGAAGGLGIAERVEAAVFEGAAPSEDDGDGDEDREGGEAG